MTPRPIEIAPRDWTHPIEYGIVGKKKGKLVWFCGTLRRTAYNKPIWSYGDGWAYVVHKLPAVKKALKIAQEDEETVASDIKQISIVKLITSSQQTAEIIPDE
jgi:hypothetical protein